MCQNYLSYLGFGLGSGNLLDFFALVGGFRVCVVDVAAMIDVLCVAISSVVAELTQPRTDWLATTQVTLL